MSDCAEVIYVSDSSGVLQCIDPRIGTTFVSYRGLSASKSNTLAVVGKDYLLALDASKPLVHVWPLNSQETLPGPKVVLAGKGSAVAVSSDGFHCVVAIDAKLYVYQVTSGQLLGVLSKHYRDVTKVLFMDDSCHFVSCGENGAVFVWNLAKAVMRQGVSLLDGRGTREPVYSFSHHSLRVTDAYVGPGSMKARLFTCSIDQTAKLYNLRDGSLLLSIVFESSLTAMRPNCIESELYVGTNKGQLIQFRLDPLPRSLEYSAQNLDIEHTFLNHTGAVTSVEISIDGHLMVSAGEDSKVVVWDIPSRQVLRVITLKAPAGSLLLRPTSDNIFNANFVPTLVFSNFQRVSSEDMPLEVNVITKEDLNVLEFCAETKEKEETVVVQQENTEEIRRLEGLLKEALAKNKELYQFAMKELLGSPFSSANKNGN